MSTLVLIMAIISEQGGVDMTREEFTGPKVEITKKCEDAGERFVKDMKSFTVMARYTCINK